MMGARRLMPPWLSKAL